MHVAPMRAQGCLAGIVKRIGGARAQAAQHQADRQPFAEFTGDGTDHGRETPAPRTHRVREIDQVGVF